MKVAISHLQGTVLVSVLSLALLFGVISSLYDGYYTQIADAKKSRYNYYSSSTSSGSKYAADNTLDTTNSAASSSSLQQTQQQQQPVTSGSGAIQLSAKELSSGYRWVDPASGVINPTMNFKADTSKTIQLQNPTDAVHHLV